MRTLIFSIAAAFLGCGASDASVQDPATHPAAGADPAPATAATLDEPGELAGTIYEAEPSLTVYVDGPDPADPTTDTRMVNEYRMEVVLTNTGGEPVGLEDTRIWFDVFNGEERIECPANDKHLVDTPEELAAGDAFTFEVDAVCALPSPGEYDIRAYMSIGTDDEDLDLERHYAGQYRVTR